MVDNNLIQSKEGLLPNKWYTRCIIFLLLFSVYLTHLVGWTGFFLSLYAGFLYLNGRGKMENQKTDLMLHGGLFFKNYDRRGA